MNKNNLLGAMMKKILILCFVLFGFSMSVFAYQIDSPKVDKFEPSSRVKIQPSALAQKMENSVQRSRVSKNGKSSTGKSGSKRNNTKNNSTSGTSGGYVDYTKYSGASSSAWN